MASSRSRRRRTGRRELRRSDLRLAILSPLRLARNLAELSFVTGHEFIRAENAEKTTGAFSPWGKNRLPRSLLSGALSRRLRRAASGRGAARRFGRGAAFARAQLCRGAGGGLSFLGEESGERVSHVRAPSWPVTGAQTVAAACPFCNTMFRDALAARGEGAPELMDIA